MSLKLRVFNFFLQRVSRRGLGDLHLQQNPAEGFRAHANDLDAMFARFTRNLTLPVVATEHERWTWVGEPHKAARHILYLHGGGFTAHMPTTYRYWAERLAIMNNAAVLLVDYPLAPTHPFPAGLNNCLAAYSWMLHDQQIPAHNIVIGGDSAGANLALATLLKVKEKQLPFPACTFSLSPSLDLTFESPSIRGNGATDLFCDHNLLERIADMYVPERTFRDCMVSPLFGDFAGATPIQLHAARDELVVDDSIRFFDRFKEVVSLDLRLWHRVPHCHQLFGFLPEAQQARREIQQFIARHCVAANQTSAA